MPTLPEGTKTIDGCTNYGVDDNGSWVFFGFKTETGNVLLQANHHWLGQAIRYLQTIALEAYQRRVQIDPKAAHTEVREKLHNPIQQADFDIDLQGQHCMLKGLTASGLPVEVEIPFLLVEGIQRELPKVLEQMREKQKGHQQQH